MSKGTENLKRYQRQIDMDGVEVGVSRQALDETLSEYQVMLAALKALVQDEFPGSADPAIIRARNAIAKAEGTAP